nr:hypothetical protein [Cellulomonas sp. Y8]
MSAGGQGRPRGRAVREQRDAGGERHAGAFLGPLRAQRPQHVQRLHRLGARQDQHELLAAVPGRVVAAPQVLVERVPEPLEHGVARGVAPGVVHALEVVEVGDDDAVARDGPGQPLLEVATVRERGEDVGARVGPQPSAHVALVGGGERDHLRGAPPGHGVDHEPHHGPAVQGSTPSRRTRRTRPAAA